MSTSLAYREVAPPLDVPASQPGVLLTGNPSLSELLSVREEEIAHLAVRGLSNKEIGRRLGISHWTVATHLRRMFSKLEITKRIELCRLVSTLS